MIGTVMILGYLSKVFKMCGITSFYNHDGEDFWLSPRISRYPYKFGFFGLII